MRNYLTFAGRDSRDFGVYISGQGTFSAPKKAYAFYNVPGRNGAILGNDHRLENIEVSYECFIYKDFSKNIADFRTFLLSCDGYQKLTDSYHTDEYRSAVYEGAFEPEVTAKNDAGSFTLTFSCKPQRWLISGDTVYSWAGGSDQEIIGRELLVYGARLDASYLRARFALSVNSGTKASRTNVIPTQRWIYITMSDDDGFTDRTDVVYFNTGVIAGIADFINGTSTVTSKGIFLSSSGWSVFTGNIFKLSSAITAGQNVFACSDYPVYTASTPTDLIGVFAQKNYGIASVGQDIYIKDVDFSTASELETYIAAKHVEIGVDNYNEPGNNFPSYSPNYPSGFLTITTKSSFDTLSTATREVITKYSAGDEMSNPTSFPSQPMIRVYGDGSFEMDGVTVTITNTTEYTDIDCELMECFEGSTNRNKDVTFSTYDFPTLQPGDNTINILSGVTIIEITPRWWRV